MGAYTVHMGSYIHRVPIFVGAYYPDFTVFISKKKYFTQNNLHMWQYFISTKMITIFSGLSEFHSQQLNEGPMQRVQFSPV